MLEVIASIPAEEAVIGGLLIDNSAFDRLGHIEADHFFKYEHQIIFDQIKKLLEAGSGADVLTVYDRLLAKGEQVDLAYLHALFSNATSAANIAHHAAIIRDRAQRRGLALVAAEITASANGDLSTSSETIIERAQAVMDKLVESKVNNEPVKVADDLSAYLDDLDRRFSGEAGKVIPTGYPDLDKKLMGGIRPGELVLIAGRPKMGKTALALNIGLNAAEDHHVAVLSMEMPKQQLHDRNVAVVGKLPLRKLLVPTELANNDWPHITTAIQRLQGLKLYLDDQGALRLLDVRLKARAVKRKHGLDLLIIDYLQLMDGEGDSRNSQIEQITRGLKALAKEMDIGIILLSQLNRRLEERTNKRPMPADLRDSGAIEQDCDIALFVYRDEVYHPDTQDKGICEVNVGLIRQGEPGTVALTYIGEQTRFESLAEGTTFGQAPARKAKYSGLKD